MADPFTYRLGRDQGRLQPATHESDPRDNPAPAVLVSLASEPFALEDEELLLLSINGGPTMGVEFASSDTSAAAVAAVFNAIPGISAIAEAGRVRVSTDATGPTASLKVLGGAAQNVIQLPTALTLGTVGRWSLVLGSDRSGETWTFADGDYFRAEQAAAVNDAKILRLRGAARWRGELPGYWVFVARVGTYEVEIPCPWVTTPDAPAEYALGDVAVNLSGLAGSQTVRLELRVATTGADPVELELPAVWVDFLDFDETADAIELANQYPPPESVGWPADVLGELRFHLLNTTASAIDLTKTQVYVRGVQVYDGGFNPGYSGTVTTATGPASRDVEFEIDASAIGALASEELVPVRVVAETLAGDTIAETWSWTSADTIAPTVTAAQARDQRQVRVTFSEPVGIGADDPTAYTLTPKSSPAVQVVVTGVTLVTAYQVDLATNIELSYGALYEVSVVGVEDAQGNAVNPAANSVEFTAFRPVGPPGRSFALWDMLSDTDRRRDEAFPDRPLRKFVLCLQDVVDLLLHSVDRWTEIIDIDRAPEPFLNAILRDLGNPFTFLSLSVLEKRKLARVLLSIYKQKGTQPGIINAIRFFLGIEVELDILNDRDYWRIGVDYLGVSTKIGPSSGSPLWYSFYIVSPLLLTEDQRDKMVKIATYMKPAHEHILGVREPGDVVTPTTYWYLGVSSLGESTVLGG